MTVVRSEDILGGEPHIEDTRVGVRHVATAVVDRGNTPAAVADQFDLSLAAVYEALSYYYEHVDEIRAAEEANRDAARQARADSLKPKEPVE